MLKAESGDLEFAFKEFKVWQKSIDFADSILDVVDQVQSTRNHFRILEQIEAASVSISSNIAVGKGRNSQKEFIQFLYIARGSAYETVSLLNLFHGRGWMNREMFKQLEVDALEIVKMIKGLINSLHK